MPDDIVLFNTLGRRLERLEPLVAGEVRVYTCGPTVYSDAHIGNLRTFLFEDLLRRTLELLGYRVTQVMNLTDVDDKTIRGANEAGLALADYTAPIVAAFFRDLDLLHVERAEVYPPATEHVPAMVALIERLIANGHAYQADGSVFFRIASDPDYGRLSGFDLDQARRGERVASDEYEKEDVRDFVLWKGTKPGEPAWDSPWGRGRPGWHIECSAMSMEYLGETFDVHCGGVDNIFPHHENEIAQSESATGKPFVRLWLHAEHLIVDGQKMSKSLGNQYTLAELQARGVSLRALRYLFLAVHYRQKLNFTWDSLEAAAGALKRIDEMRFRLAHAPVLPPAPPAVPQPPAVPASIAVPATTAIPAVPAVSAVSAAGAASVSISAAAETVGRDVRRALADDLNVAAALAAVFTFVRTVNVAIEEQRLVAGDKETVAAALSEVDRVFGVLDPAAWEERAETGDDAEIESLVHRRQEARRSRDFAAADRLRDELAERGVLVEDTPQGARWKRR